MRTTSKACTQGLTLPGKESVKLNDYVQDAGLLSIDDRHRFFNNNTNTSSCFLIDVGKRTPGYSNSYDDGRNKL